MIRTLAHAAPYDLGDDWAARAYELMTHRPDNFTVELSYLHFKHETLAQWGDMLAAGLTVDFYEHGDPYACQSSAMLADVDAGHLYTFKTDETQGFPLDHPMLQMVLPYEGLMLNDIFRAVHDVNGHHASRSSFGPQGEKTAWLTHRQRYTQTALTALWCETRGQASWTNHYADHASMPQHDRPFATQKCGLPNSDLI